MLTLYTGTGGGENRAALFNAFVEQVRRGEKCLLLVPEQFTVHAEQEVFRLYGAGLGCDAEVVSFKRLCYRILLAAGRADVNRLESGGRSVLMYRAFQSVRDHLNVYARTRPTSSFIAELLDHGGGAGPLQYHARRIYGRGRAGGAGGQAARARP